ncbi:unannotated protein [freshwater metagenome]|uniref:Unannotated protein n=1 Tax=freshwater metagenome TaxID=449393 RepID=A0A6J6I9H7_9ZZZZ
MCASRSALISLAGWSVSGKIFAQVDNTGSVSSHA